MAMNADGLWVKNPLATWTGNETDGAGGVLVKDGRIAEVLAAGQRPAGDPEVFDASRHVVLPGLINVHHHFYQTLNRAWPPVESLPLFGWLTGLYGIWHRLGPDALDAAVRVALAELLLSGCTTTSDHHYLFSGQLGEAIDIEVAAARDLGIRATLVRGSISLGTDDGGLPPQVYVQSGERILADSERVVKAYHQPGAGAMTQIALGPVSPFSVTPANMRDSAALARTLGVRLHTHLAESVDEDAFFVEHLGRRTLDYFDEVGWLDDRTWFAHAIHLDDDDVARLGRAGVGIAHCPTSNMRLASGICRGLELERAGCPVGLGVDGSASNDGSSLIAEARMSLMAERLRYGAEAITPLTVLRWTTRGSAGALGRDDIGTIEVGKQADLAMFTLDDIRFSGSHDPVGALLLCGADRADRVMVGGRWRVEDGAVVGLDLDALLARHRELAAAMHAGV